MAASNASRSVDGRGATPSSRSISGSSRKSSATYGHRSSNAVSVRRRDSSVPRASRSTHWSAWSQWYATSLTALPAIAASTGSSEARSRS